MEDLRVENLGGSVVLIEPTSERGLSWVNENVSREGYQPYWPTVVAEPRYLHDIVAGARADGLDVAV